MNNLSLPPLSQSSHRQLKEQGYVLLENAVQQKNIEPLINQIQKNIQLCADDIGYSLEEYLSSVSRWVSPSPVMEGLMQLVRADIAHVITRTLGNEIVLNKYNIICKNVHNPNGIPYHQDISYSPTSPYEVTAWLALNDSDEASGPLEILSSTHQNPIESAVDFWSPNYKPNLKEGTKILCGRGDVILFDSRIWHGSSQSQSLCDRYALVSRWSSLEYVPPRFIPEIKPDPFGMWTCGPVTKKLLQAGAQIILNKDISNFIDLIDTWIKALVSVNLPFKIVTSEALKALKNLY